MAVNPTPFVRKVFAWSRTHDARIWHAREVGSRTAFCGKSADLWPVMATKGDPKTQPPQAKRCASCQRLLKAANDA